MGGFFAAVGFPKVELETALTALRRFEHEDGTPIEFFRSESGTLLGLFSEILYDSEGLWTAISAELKTPVIEMHFSDDVVWSYELFQGSQIVDRYASRPNYWQEVSPEEAVTKQGNPETVAQVWPGVSAESIARYLTNKETLSEAKRRAKAYAEDSSPQWDAWQMCDFMRKLELVYPVNEDGELLCEPVFELCLTTPSGLEKKIRSEAKLDASRRRLEEERARRNGQ